MKPAPFDYHRVATAEEAVAHLAQYGSEAKILAGGQSLIPIMKLRLARPAALIDINRITALDYVRAEKGRLAIGATARLSALESPLVAGQAPLLLRAVQHVGHPPIRHQGTVCGSLAHADPAAELPLAALCLGAELQVLGPRGERTIPADRFFLSFFATALEADEMLVEVQVPALARHAGWSFLEFARRAGDFALAAAATSLYRDPRGAVGGARIVLGGVGERPLRCVAAEAALVGQPGTSEVFSAAAAAATADIDPPSDLHGSAAFRTKIARVLVERALAEAWARSGQGG